MACSGKLAAAVAAAVALSACGYHVSGNADTIPKSIQTVAVPPFANLTTRYQLSDHLPEALAREFIGRTRYRVVADPAQADAVLRGAVVNYVGYPVIVDQRSGRAAAVQMIVTLQVSFVERKTGKVLFTRPGFDVRQRYEISVGQNTQQQVAYFEESNAGLERLSHDVARDVVSAILENF